MPIYLPIAEMAVSPWLMIALGALVGCLSGIFGVGGGFLMTPLLMLVGVPAPAAVVAGANLAAASSMSGVMGHLDRRGVDLRMGLVVSVGGVVGVTIGTAVFAAFKAAGVAETAVRLSYVVLLAWLGGSLSLESLRAMRRARDAGEPHRARRDHSGLLHALPFKVRFPRSRLYISVIPPLMIGVAIGILSAIMGVGGGFLLIPALVYLLQMPPNLVVGTSTFQVLMMASTTTFVQASANGGLDLVLSALLILGGVVGAQIGVIIGRKLKGEQLRALLGGLLLIVALRLAADLAFTPPSMFETSSPGGGL
jgi:uncharacterized protein